MIARSTPPSINPKELAALTIQSNSSSSSNFPFTISTWDRPRNCCFQHSHNSRFGSTKINLAAEIDMGYRSYLQRFSDSSRIADSAPLRTLPLCFLPLTRNKFEQAHPFVNTSTI